MFIPHRSFGGTEDAFGACKQQESCLMGRSEGGQKIRWSRVAGSAAAGETTDLNRKEVGGDVA